MHVREEGGELEARARVVRGVEEAPALMLGVVSRDRPAKALEAEVPRRRPTWKLQATLTCFAAAGYRQTFDTRSPPHRCRI